MPNPHLVAHLKQHFSDDRIPVGQVLRVYVEGEILKLLEGGDKTFDCLEAAIGLGPDIVASALTHLRADRVIYSYLRGSVQVWSLKQQKDIA